MDNSIPIRLVPDRAGTGLLHLQFGLLCGSPLVHLDLQPELIIAVSIAPFAISILAWRISEIPPSLPVWLISVLSSAGTVFALLAGSSVGTISVLLFPALGLHVPRDRDHPRSYPFSMLSRLLAISTALIAIQAIGAASTDLAIATACLMGGSLLTSMQVRALKIPVWSSIAGLNSSGVSLLFLWDASELHPLSSLFVTSFALVSISNFILQLTAWVAAEPNVR